MPYSTCCNAFTTREEYGICPDCKDHCTFEDDCPNCEGSGEIETDDTELPAMCVECNGTGRIELEN